MTDGDRARSDVDDAADRGSNRDAERGGRADGRAPGRGGARVERREAVGILTERDILHAVAIGQVEGTKVGAWMTHDPESVGPDERPGHAAAIMLHGGFRHLPVLDDDRPIGILSIRDLMRLVIDDEAPRGV